MASRAKGLRGKGRVQSPVAVGVAVAGKYVVEDILAAGGMGVVVTARHKTLGQRVAIKFLLPGVMNDESVHRFLREARAAAMIQSEHVARVFDCGTLDDGTPYMVMEHLLGGDLAHDLKARGPLPIDEAIDLVLQAIEGVAHAHARGIVHRDLKPSNLFLVGKGRPFRVKVLDFGISKVAPGPDTPIEDDLTNTTMMLGSPRYMSPEQAQSSRDVDVRADVWSLGVILYEMLAGAPPFSGSTLGELLGQLLLAAPSPVRTRRAEVPEALDLAIAKCLERDRERRFADVGELARALAPFGPPHAEVTVAQITAALEERNAPPPLDETPRTAEGISMRQSHGTGTASWARTGLGERARRGASTAIVLAAVAALGGFASWFFFARSPASEEHATATATSRAASVAPAAAAIPTPVASVTAVASAPPAASSSAAPDASASTSPAASVSASRPPPGSKSAPAAAHAKKSAPRSKSPVDVLGSSD